MQGSALRWAAWNLRVAGRPADRRRLRAVAERGDRAEPASAWHEAAAAEMDRARRIGATVLTPDDAAYPEILRVAPDPPFVLYTLGNLQAEDALAVAVVGARRVTPQGAAMARAIAHDLAASGFTVVSGLARGVDAAAHCGALDAGGRTIAVLGSGIDRIYPEEHRELAEAISRRGAVVSEFPIGTGPLPRHFPERNRIIASLAWATVVVEAAEGSGSLITADLALEAGRLVFAVPGPVGDPNADGTNALLRDGALICRSARDVIEDLAPQIVEAASLLAGRVVGAGATGHDQGAAGHDQDDRRPGDPRGGAAAAGRPTAEGLTPEARRVLDLLPATRGVDVDRLADRSGLPAGRLAAALLDLELRGLVRSLPGGRYLRDRRDGGGPVTIAGQGLCADPGSGQEPGQGPVQGCPPETGA